MYDFQTIVNKTYDLLTLASDARRTRKGRRGARQIYPVDRPNDMVVLGMLIGIEGVSAEALHQAELHLRDDAATKHFALDESVFKDAQDLLQGMILAP